MTSPFLNFKIFSLEFLIFWDSDLRPQNKRILSLNNIVQVQKLIYQIRGHKVMLDSDLAKLYEVETKKLNQAVKRNIERFPEDFMFQLDENEWLFLRSQFVTSKIAELEQYFMQHCKENNAYIAEINKALALLSDRTKPNKIGFKS